MSKKSENTIHDIASKLNISASTVSRALNNNPHIREQTRKLVQKTAKEMGYLPNILAANFRTKKTNTIGVIVPLIHRHFFSSVISGIEDIAYKQGFAVSISQSNDLFEKENKIAQTLFSNRVDGLILSIGMGTTTHDHLKLFSDRNIPIVFFDRVVDDIQSHKIIIDDLNAGYQATKHLIEQGAKHVAHIGGPLNLKIYRDRQNGYLKAINEANLLSDTSLIINGSLTRAEGTKAIKKLLSNKIKPDAVFCANDTSALSVLIYLRETGIKVPEDIGIVGFGNEPYSEVVTPSLSTLQQPGTSMGQTAAKLIIEQIQNDNSNVKFQTITLPTQLIIRSSSLKK